MNVAVTFQTVTIEGIKMGESDVRQALEMQALKLAGEIADETSDCYAGDTDFVAGRQDMMTLAQAQPTFAQVLLNRTPVVYVVHTMWGGNTDTYGDFTFAEAMDRARREYVRMNHYRLIVDPKEVDDEEDFNVWIQPRILDHGTWIDYTPQQNV